MTRRTAPRGEQTELVLEQVEKALGYSFTDRGQLRAALTHRSWAAEHGLYTATDGGPRGDNERLEFLGDAVLQLVVSEELWRHATSAREGELSRLRAAVVNERSLAQAARSAGLGEALRLGRGEERTGGRGRVSILADAMEAVFAAVLLDGGVDRAREVIRTALGERIQEVLQGEVRDHKSTLQELLQALYRVTPTYALVESSGPDHDRRHEVELRAEGLVTARGEGRSRKEAEQQAARRALEALRERGIEPADSKGSKAPAEKQEDA